MEDFLIAIRDALSKQVLAALADPDVIEVTLNDDGLLWAVKNGCLVQVGALSAENGIAILQKLSPLLGQELTKEEPFVNGELPFGGFFFNGIAPPVTERAVFSITKKITRELTLSDYDELTYSQVETLRKALQERKNVLVTGGTDAGKTTFCYVLLNELSKISPDVKMLIFGDNRELKCTLANQVFMQVSEVATIASITQSMEQLHPDSINVDEVRDGGVATALLNRWSKEHPGGIATVHSNSAYGGLIRMDQLMREVLNKSHGVLVAEAVNYVVYLKPTKTGRKVGEIIHVTGYDPIKQTFKTEIIE